VFELPHSHSAFSTNTLGCRLTLEVEAGKEPVLFAEGTVVQLPFSRPASTRSHIGELHSNDLRPSGFPMFQTLRALC